MRNIENKSQKRILHMVGRMTLGGQETFIMNIYRNIDREKIQFDFIVNSKNRDYFDDEIERLGGKIYRITPLSKNPIKHCIELGRIFKSDYKYDTIHRHTSSAIIAIDLLVAKLFKIKNRIAHSHANNTARAKLIHKLFIPLLNLLATSKLACSKDAGIFLYGKRHINEVEIINNSIEIDKFIFDNQKRDIIRKQYNEKNDFVVGHVGRFDKVKNHKFIIDIFNDFLKLRENSVLWLVGEGETSSEIKRYAEEYGIEKNIVFFGARKDIEVLIMGMDAFVFPSTYEGLGIALIEAQCTGIKCIVSENIQDEAIITENVKKINLIDKRGWINKLLEIDTSYNRNIEYDEKIRKYDIKELVKIMNKIYLK